VLLLSTRLHTNTRKCLQNIFHFQIKALNKYFNVRTSERANTFVQLPPLYFQLLFLLSWHQQKSVQWIDIPLSKWGLLKSILCLHNLCFFNFSFCFAFSLVFSSLFRKKILKYLHPHESKKHTREGWRKKKLFLFSVLCVWREQKRNVLALYDCLRLNFFHLSRLKAEQFIRFHYHFTLLLVRGGLRTFFIDFFSSGQTWRFVRLLQFEFFRFNLLKARPTLTNWFGGMKNFWWGWKSCENASERNFSSEREKDENSLES
jgi:hypothetical protein